MAWPHLISATNTTPPIRLPSVAQRRKRPKSATVAPWPEKTPASTSAVPTTAWWKWPKPMAKVTSQTMTIWLIVSRLAATSHDIGP